AGENHNLSGILATNLLDLMDFKTVNGDNKCSKISKAVTTSASEFCKVEVSISKSSPRVFSTLYPCACITFVKGFSMPKSKIVSVLEMCFSKKLMVCL